MTPDYHEQARRLCQKCRAAYLGNEGIANLERFVICDCELLASALQSADEKATERATGEIDSQLRAVTAGARYDTLTDRQKAQVGVLSAIRERVKGSK